MKRLGIVRIGGIAQIFGQGVRLFVVLRPEASHELPVKVDTYSVLNASVIQLVLPLSVAVQIYINKQGQRRHT